MLTQRVGLFPKICWSWVCWAAVSATTSNKNTADDSFNQAEQERSYPRLLSVLAKTDETVKSNETLAELWQYVDVESFKQSRHEKDSTVVHLVVHGSEEWQVVQLLQKEGALKMIQSRTGDESTDDDFNYRDLLGRTKHGLGAQTRNFTEEFPCYRTYTDMLSTMNNWTATYPNLVQLSTIGTSLLGEDVPVMILSNSANSIEKAPILIISGVHPRELAPPESVFRFAEGLLSGYNQDDAEATWILERTAVHIVPIANPDTRVLVEQRLQDRLRKNRRKHGHYCSEATLGVDLNRNYNMKHGALFGASFFPCSGQYRGKGPLSEPETQNVYKYAQGIFPPEIQKVPNGQKRMKEKCPEGMPGMFLDVHSAGEYIYYPWFSTAAKSPNVDALQTMASKLAHFGNFDLLSSPLFGSSGVGTDSMYGQFCVPAFGVELGTEHYETCTVFTDRVLPYIIPLLRYATKSASDGYRIPRGPDIDQLQVSSADVLTVRASDSIRNRFKSQNVQAVRVFVDEHPYDDDDDDGSSSTGMGTAMAATDGDFDSPTFVDRSVRRIIYVQAQDSAGFLGPIEAFFLEAAS